MTRFEQSIIDAVNAAPVASYLTLCYTTTCGLPKKSGLADIEKVVTTTQAQTKGEYGKRVNNKLKKKGAVANFVPESPKGKSWLKGYEDVALVADKDGTLYLRFYIINGTKTTRTFVENGQPCDAARTAQVKAALAAKGKQEIGTQAAAGLTGDEQVIPRDITIAKLHYITIGGVTITNDQSPLKVAV